MVDMCCPEAPVAAVLFRRKGVKYVARNPVAAALGMRHINESVLAYQSLCMPILQTEAGTPNQRRVWCRLLLAGTGSHWNGTRPFVGAYMHMYTYRTCLDQQLPLFEYG